MQVLSIHSCFSFSHLVLCIVFRCCCGRAENQHGKLTTVQEENEELEIANDAAEESGTDSDNSQAEVFDTDEKVKFVKSEGWFKNYCLYCTRSEILTSI